ncbi:MAG: lytic murein transglycosylase [Mariprofundaceae bacterium]
MKIQMMLLLFFGLFAVSIATAAEKNIEQFVDKDTLSLQLQSEFELPASTIDQALQKARFTPSVIERMRRPYEARPYRDYRPLFVNDNLTKKGKAYLEKHVDIFKDVQKERGVQPEIIAAILGVETHYGRNRGNDRVLDALFTLASGYPRRADFFRKELGHFLLLCNEESLDVSKPLGSYAGAFGTTQFIPSSFRAYAVDANGDNERDVWDSAEDIIHSVGNYFKRHHWDASRPVAYWLPASAKRPNVSSKGFNWQPLKALREQLPPLPEVWHDDDKVSLVSFETKQGPSIALVHYNFYVITRWNRSNNYAMAIAEFSRKLGCNHCGPSAR